MNFARHLALAAILLAGSAAAWADEAADTFSKLYGDDLKRIAATPSPADDVALARQLLEAAGKVANQQAFLTLLCEKACELAIKDPTGYPTADAAMKLLATSVPEKKAESLQKIAAMYQRAYAAARAEAKAKAGEALIEALKGLAGAQAAEADANGAVATLKQALAVATAIKSESKAAIQAQLAGLAAQQQVEKQIAALKAKLDADPKDASSRKEIVRLYLVEMDNPAAAAKFVNETCDEATRKYVPAAVKPVEDAPEAACTELGDWYKGLADQAATPASKGAMLRRTQGYYQRFLVLHTAEDLGRTAATLTLKKIEDALAKLGAAAEPKSNEDGFVPIFNGKDLTGWTGLLDGYKVENGILVSLKEPSGDICTEKDYADFVLRLEFRLTPGANNGVGIRTPSGKQGSVYGMEIQILDDSDPQSKASKPWQFCGGIYNCVAPQRGHLKPVGQWNAYEITANGRRVTVKLNGATVVDADLDKVAAAGTPDGKDHPGLKNKTGRIALLGYKSVVQFRNLCIKELKSDGAGK